MNTIRRYLFPVMMAFFALTVSARAGQQYVPDGGYVDLNALGGSRYDATAYIHTWGPGVILAKAEFLGANYTSGGYNHALLGVKFINIRKVGTIWRAQSVEVQDTGGTRVYSEVTLSSGGHVRFRTTTTGGQLLEYSGYSLTWTSGPPAVGSITTSGSPTLNTSFEVYANNVTNASNVRFVTWTNTNGQDDVRTRAGTYQSANNRWKVTVNRSEHGNALDWYTTRVEALGSNGQWYTLGSVQVQMTGYSTPCYQPAFWNGQTFIQFNNNCYNYSNNKRTDTFAQPGRAAGIELVDLTGDEVANAAMADGLEWTWSWNAPVGGKMLIALCVWPGWDYHWYRRDCDGNWSHKPGNGEATNLDYSGNIITNPETADRGPYEVFVGYFYTPSTSQQGVGHANIQ